MVCPPGPVPLVPPYGSDLERITELETQSPELAEPLHPDLTIRRSEIVWAVRHEMARTIEDVLARRTRMLFLNAAATMQIAEQVVSVIASELDRDTAWCEQELKRFAIIAKGYLP